VVREIADWACDHAIKPDATVHLSSSKYSAGTVFWDFAGAHIRPVGVACVLDACTILLEEFPSSSNSSTLSELAPRAVRQSL